MKETVSLMTKQLIASIIAIVVMCGLLAGCGNLGMDMRNYNYEKVHIDTYHFSGCLTVEQWYDSSVGVDVNTKEAGFIHLSEGTYILLEGTKACPFCSAAGGNMD